MRCLKTWMTNTTTAPQDRICARSAFQRSTTPKICRSDAPDPKTAIFIADAETSWALSLTKLELTWGRVVPNVEHSGQFFYNRTNLVDHEHIRIYTIFPLPNIGSCLILEALFKQNIYEMSNFYLIFRCEVVLDQVGQRCHVRSKASVRIRLTFSFNASEQAMASNCSETWTWLYLSLLFW